MNPTAKLRLAAPPFPSPHPNLLTVSEPDTLCGRAWGIERRKASPVLCLRSLSIGPVGICALNSQPIRRQQASASNPAQASSSSTAPCCLSCPAFTALTLQLKRRGDRLAHSSVVQHSTWVPANSFPGTST